MIDQIVYCGGIKVGSNPLISQITQQDAACNHNILTGMAAGHTDPLFVAVYGAKPEMQFTTPQIKSIIDVCGVYGFDTSAGNTDFFFRRGLNLGARSPNSGGDHKRMRATGGLLYWRGLTADYQTDAQLDVRYKPVSTDGSAVPFTPAGSQSLTDTPTSLEHYTLGAVYCNGITIAGVKRLRLELNPVMTEEGSGDDIYDTYCGIDSIEPVLTLEGLSWASWTNFGLTGAAFTGLEFYLRKKAADGYSVAKATGQHIKFTSAAGIAITPNSRNGGNQKTMTSVQIRLRAANGAPASGAEKVLDVTTASASI